MRRCGWLVADIRVNGQAFEGKTTLARHRFSESHHLLFIIESQDTAIFLSSCDSSMLIFVLFILLVNDLLRPQIAQMHAFSQVSNLKTQTIRTILVLSLHFIMANTSHTRNRWRQYSIKPTWPSKLLREIHTRGSFWRVTGSRGWGPLTLGDTQCHAYPSLVAFELFFCLLLNVSMLNW